MDHDFKQLEESLTDIKKLIESFQISLGSIESRLARFEKVDSIEHRVAVNQIDLSDIKESVQRIEELQGREHDSGKTETRRGGDGQSDEIQYIHRRLDSHLVKIARAEEEILILKSR